MSSSTFFPVELLNLILEEIATDTDPFQPTTTRQSTLSSLSGVSSAFRSISSPFLLRQPTFSSVRSIKQFREIVKDRPKVAAAVTEIVLRPKGQAALFEEEWDELLKSRRWRKLRTVAFMYARGEQSEKLLKLDTLSSYVGSTLTTLILCDLSLSMPQSALYIRPFPHLITLQLHHVSIPHRNPPPPADGILPIGTVLSTPRLETLHIHPGGSRGAVTLHDFISFRYRIKRLSIMEFGATPSNVLQEFGEVQWLEVWWPVPGGEAENMLDSLDESNEIKTLGIRDVYVERVRFDDAETSPEGEPGSDSESELATTLATIDFATLRYRRITRGLVRRLSQIPPILPVLETVVLPRGFEKCAAAREECGRDLDDLVLVLKGLDCGLRFEERYWEIMASPVRASLGALPTELKRHIVSLAADQDDAYEIRTFKLDEDGEPDESARIVGWGGTLGTLRLLNQEFSELGSLFMFSTLRVARCLDPTYQFHISICYSSLVKRMEFTDYISLPHVVQILSNLDRFTHLRQLSFSGPESFDCLMGDQQNRTLGTPPITTEPDFNFAAARFKRLALSIEHLDLGHRWSPSQTASTLPLFPALKSLKLNFDGDGMPDSSDEEKRLPMAVKSLVALESLELVNWTNLDSRWFAKWPSTCTLKCIKITGDFMTIHLWKLVESVGVYLEQLELRFEDFGDQFSESLALLPAIPKDTLIFPKLKTLIWPTALLLQKKTVPFLARLTSSRITNLEVSVSSDQDPFTIFRHFLHVTRIAIHHDSLDHHYNAREVHISAMMCAAKKIRYDLTSSRFPATRPSDLIYGLLPPLVGSMPSREASFQALNFSAVRRALEFGIRRLDRAMLDDELDWNLEKAMVEKLELLRLAWED
ncbi:hypothetical protein P7C70_g7148, partial [Phenoliferia sp. Uapishka_3]